MTVNQPSNTIQKIGRIVALFLFPLIGSAMFALPAYLLKSSDLILSILIYAGELLVSLYLAHRWYSLAECGVRGFPKLTTFFWGLSFLGIRCLTWVIFLPVEVSFSKWEIIVPDLLFFLLINATTEEIHFRGLLYSGVLKETSRPLVAAAISSVLFGLLHLSLGQPSWIPLFIADALAWCAIRMRTGYVYASIAAHGLQNFLFTDILIVPKDLSYRTEVIYTVMAILANLLFFRFATAK
jgi:membrane protease YdiL (CAAX protease family)